MSVETRSRHACWTCRLRRKKCDEKQPVCERCEQSNTTCHGYGEKPDWMDGGDKEKEELTSIRSAVAMNVASRRSKSGGTEKAERPQVIQLLTPTDIEISSPASIHTRNGIGMEVYPPSVPTKPVGEDEECPNQLVSPSRNENSVVLSPESDTNGGRKVYNKDDTTLPPLLETHDLSGESWDFELDGSVNDDYQIDDDELLMSVRALPRSSDYENINAAGHCSNTLHSMTLKESILLMSFLEVGHHLHFPFLISASDRGWLVWILSRSPSLYNITLVLALCHTHMADSMQVELGHREDVTMQYLIAMEEFQKSLVITKSPQHDEVSINELCTVMGMILLVKFNVSNLTITEQCARKLVNWLSYSEAAQNGVFIYMLPSRWCQSSF